MQRLLQALFQQQKTIITILTILIVLAQFISVYINDRLATEGIVITQNNFKINHLKIENDLLRSNIAHQESLKTIEERAIQLGFTTSQIQWFK